MALNNTSTWKLNQSVHAACFPVQGVFKMCFQEVFQEVFSRSFQEVFWKNEQGYERRFKESTKGAFKAAEQWDQPLKQAMQRK